MCFPTKMSLEVNVAPTITWYIRSYQVSLWLSSFMHACLFVT